MSESFMISEERFRNEIKRAYVEGRVEARAEFAADLRKLTDDFMGHLFDLRQEIRRALKLPRLDDHDGEGGRTLQ